MMKSSHYTIYSIKINCQYPASAYYNSIIIPQPTKEGSVFEEIIFRIHILHWTITRQ